MSAAFCHTPRRRLPSQLVLLLLAALLSGCNALPFRPRLPEIPFLQTRGESQAAARPLQVFLPEEGQVTKALQSHISSWADSKEMPLDLSASSAYGLELASRLSAKDPPDLVVVSAFLFSDLAAQGLLAPAEEAFLNPNGYPPRLAAAFTWPDQQAASQRYCLPREVRTLALVYDSAGLAEKGFAPPTTWDSLREVAVGQTDLERNRFGFIEAPDLSRWLPFLYGAGGTVTDESGAMAIESPASSAAIDWYIQIFRDNFAGHAGESNNEWAGEVLAKGKGALAIEGNWIVPYFETEFPDYRYAVAPLPSGPAVSNTSVAFTSCYAVPAGSTRKDDAFDLAAFLTSPEVVASLPNDGGWMPALNELRNDWRKSYPSLAPFADAVPTAKVWQLPPGFDTFLTTFNRGMVQLFAANIEAADFFAELQDLGETLLQTAAESNETQDADPTSGP